MTHRVGIHTTTHWPGDPRLNRHAAYLRNAGHEVHISSQHGVPRARAMWRTLKEVRESRDDVVILPDPEMFFLGSLLARATGKQAIVDVHEDYQAVVSARPRIPAILRPAARVAMWVLVTLGRSVASKVTVAAPHLAQGDDTVVLNTPFPGEFQPQAPQGRTLVYVGDVTIARGALEMVSVLARLDPTYSLEVIGRVDEETRQRVMTVATELGVVERLSLMGRLDHADAWARAAGSLAGLSLLHDLPSYREAVPTKLWEYMAAGIPPVVSDLPGHRRVVEPIDPKLVCADVHSAASVINLLSTDAPFHDSVVILCLNEARDAWEAARPDLAIQSVVKP